MKKDIYVIKNDINSNVYIGQAINTLERFQGHCKPSATDSLVDKAINKYGRKHFWYEILESQIDNYNEREKYWIKYYNSLAPNGYNLSEGGDEPPLMKGCDHPEAKLTPEQVISLTNTLLTSSESLRSLAKKYNIAASTIKDFNDGKTYFRPEINYPIRKENPIGKLTESDVDIIINILKTSYRSFEDIGKEFNVEARAISRINSGVFHKRSNEEYPIREGQVGRYGSRLSYEQVTTIIDMLLHTTYSLREVARLNSCDYVDILGIKNGTTKLYRRKGLTYPLRPNN